MAVFKRKDEWLEEMLAGVLNVPDGDVIVVRGKNCQLLFMNGTAQKRAGGNKEGLYCKDVYGGLFPGLCEHCPAEGEAEKQVKSFEIKDKDGNLFNVRSRRLEWLDERPAMMLMLRDVSEERGANEKLYQLAYMDHLTGAPNRQRLREDFDALVEGIENGNKAGMLAIFDLDNFKNVNDTYGHNTGDVMLQRLVDHLSNEGAFRGHMYRLGGDEFVLLYAHGPDDFIDLETEKEHYAGILSAAFMSYSMPNIDTSCTISMGAAFFPQHGTGFSELLRKADIALYKAKSAGRNQLVFFEDQYDNAKKFKDLYINIQPILTPHGHTYGYELVDRGNENNGNENSLSLSDVDRALDALGLGEIHDEAKYFITYSPQLLSKTVLNNLPMNKFVIEIPLRGSLPSQKLLAQLRELHNFGYKIAISGLTGANGIGELMKLAAYCKFDNDKIDAAAQRQYIADHPGKWFIATKVDSISDFEAAQRRGFKLFQGFFFNKPVVVKKTKDIDPMKVNYLRLLKLTSIDDYVNFQEIAGVISSDVALSYKLLRLLNSAAVGLRNQISSIDMALAYLGEENLKQWIALLALRGIADDKPLELVRMSLIRARFGELLAPQMKPPRDKGRVFMLGLFSLLHIALEKTKEELFEEIPVADEIRNSLMTDEGPHSDLISFFSSYEYANWDEVADFVRRSGLNERAVNSAYFAAVKWYNDLAADT